MRRLNRREKGLIAAGGGALLLFVVGRTVLFPFWDSLSASTEGIEAQSKRVINYRRVLLGQDSVKAALEAARQRTAAAEAGLLDSKTDALANAEIQGLVKELALARGLTLQRTDPFPVRSVSQEYSRVSTRVEVKGELDQLVSFLAGFETGPKILRVEELSITPLSPGNIKNKGVRSQLLISALKRAETNEQKPTAAH